MDRESGVQQRVASDARDSGLPLDQAMLVDDPVISTAARAIAAHGQSPGALLSILHDIQDALGYVPESCLGLIAENLQRSRAEVHGVLTFYPHFRRAKSAPNVVGICRAEACQARGANALIRHAQAKLACGLHETSPDGKVALEPVYCLGLCAQGPAIDINGERHVHVTADEFDMLLEKNCTDAEEM